MLEFRTQIKLKSDATLLNVWESFCKWNSKNRTPGLIKFLNENSTKLLSVKQKFAGEESKEEITSDYDESLNLIYIIFVQSHKNGDNYKNSIVFDQNSHYLSFEAETTNSESDKRPSYSIPNFFNCLKPYIDEQSAPNKYLTLNEIRLDTIAKMIKGELYSKLPLVYVSSYSDNSTLYFECELKALAQRLFCLAYVFVEKDNKTSLELRNKTNSLNTYDGTVGIYWNGERKKFFDKPIETLVYEVRKFAKQVPLDENLNIKSAMAKIGNK